MAGATPIAALYMWNLAADTYKLNFPDATVFRMSASSLSPEGVEILRQPPSHATVIENYRIKDILRSMKPLFCP